MATVEFWMYFLSVIYREVRWYFVEKAYGDAFSIPAIIVEALAKEFCGIAAQLVHVKRGGRIALLIEVCEPDRNGRDHLMNVSHDGSYFYDYYGNEIKAAEEGRFVSLNHRLYYVERIVDEWAEFGFRSFKDRCAYVKPRNAELFKIYGALTK